MESTTYLAIEPQISTHKGPTSKENPECNFNKPHCRQKKNVKVGESMVLKLLKTKNTCIAYKRASIMVQDQLWFRISTHKASTAEIWKRKKPF